MTDLPYRPNVCLLIYRVDFRLFLGERFGSPGLWQFPQGGIEEGSTPAETALEEAHEELGAAKDLFVVRKKLEATHRYDFRNPPAYAIGRWRGQQQVFYIVEFIGTDADIQLDRFDQEFSDFLWCTVAEVKAKAEAIRLPGYLAALEEYVEFVDEQGGLESMSGEVVSAGDEKVD